MESAKDFGFNDGYVLNKGGIAPADHTTVGSVKDGRSLVFPNVLLQEEQTAYHSAIGKQEGADPATFGKQYAIARAIVKSTGLTKLPSEQDTPVGVDFRGDRIYGNTKLANSKDTKQGADMISTSGIALGAMGAFADHQDANNFISMTAHVQNPEFHNELDDLKNSGNVKGFIGALGKVNKTSDDKTNFTKYKLYEDWNNLSPAQKAIGIAGAGIQGYKFSDGSTFETKKLTPELPGVPQLNAAEGLELASKGINVAPATKNWGQISAVQEAFHAPGSANDVVNNANVLGLLGYGTDGRAVPIDEKVMSQYNMTPVPHYGVGAVTIPQGQGVPTGYTKVRDMGDKSIVVPMANKASVHLNVPDVSSEAAYKIYKNWK